MNFSVYSKSASLIELLLFDQEAAPKPSRVIPLDPARHRTYQYWHAFVPGLKPGQIYGFRASGSPAPAEGIRIAPDKVLLDPYGLAVAVPPGYSRQAAAEPGDNTRSAMKSIVADPGAYDWEGDEPLRRPWVETVIYELHVRGFTAHPSSGVAPERRGTYAGLIEKIPYLKDLGVTAVELLPVYQFDPHDAPAGRMNYWGYAPISFFAPHREYSSRQDPLGPLDEFRDLVKALHRAGIEVILDVVYNHTAEGDHRGPTLCYRGLENAAYYILERDRTYYSNYTGTGNTMNGNQPIVRRLIRDSLRYWVRHMHVDGFRFDLASILSRDECGHPLPNPPVLWDIETDPILAGTKLIAEAWDPGGLYQVGTFIGDNWQEWNGLFRDDVRRFVKGDPGMSSKVATRLLGSPDIYGHEEREAEQSINFVTCHDGFTLNDLVSYNEKHNEANGEGNRDGSNDNASWNCGAEGPSDDPAVEALRSRQVKNLLTLTLLSVGTPMICMGDEVRRTQSGNNNAYCQDTELSWFDWTLLEKHAGVHRFVQMLLTHRQRRDVALEETKLTLNSLLRRARVEWHGVELGQPDWGEHSRCLAFTIRTLRGRVDFHGMLNAYWEPLSFDLPPVDPQSRQPWRRWIDTSLPSPDDIHGWDTAPVIADSTCRVEARSLVYLARPVKL